jgi:hypothetical protein
LLVRSERVRVTPGAEPVGVDDRGGWRTGDEDGEAPTPPGRDFFVAADMLPSCRDSIATGQISSR